MSASPPSARPVPATLVEGDRRLLRLVDESLAEATRRAGAHLACRPGCTLCCLGPFPISALDAWRLARALAALESRAPDRAHAIRDRARRAVARMAPDFPGDSRTGLLDDTDEAREEQFLEHQRALACPLLDPRTGLCELYDARPLSCRTFGPPVRIGGEALPPCELCFTQATPEEIEACRVAIDSADEEGTLLVALEATGRRGRTLVAYALLDRASPGPDRSSAR